MAKMSKKEISRLALKVGLTSQRLDRGMTPEEIAEDLKAPIEEVNKWIALVEQAKEYKKIMEG